jgi:hypothetical protein
MNVKHSFILVFNRFGNIPDNLTEKVTVGQVWCLMPVILATQEAAIRRMKVGSQPRQIVSKTLS